MAQFIELGFRYDAGGATLRATDFVALVEQERVEDPTAADVRVMTVHQAKGLEFDIVVLPQLDAPLIRGEGRRPLAYRDDPAGRVTRIFPAIGGKVRPLFDAVMPEIQQAADLEQSAALRDALSNLYVALTRARHELHILIKPDGANGQGKARTAARIVRHALAPDMDAFEGAVLFDAGQPGAAGMEVARRDAAAAAGTVQEAPDAAAPPSAVRLKILGARTRVLPRRSPSEMEGGDEVSLASVLRLEAAAFAERGSIAHAWFEQVGWIEDGLPADVELLRIAQRIAPNAPAHELDTLLERFHGWRSAEPVRAALSRDSFPAGATVHREVPFIRRDGDSIMEGVIDRLVIVREGGKVTRAVVLDYKTDAVAADDEAALAQRIGFYRPQLEAYRRALMEMYRLRPEDVEARLIFLNAARVYTLAMALHA
jgi:ATP-dependent helicase/nuclease subunit A